MRQSLHIQLEQLANQRWVRRGLRMLLRSAWIGLSVWCIGLGGHLLLGWPIRLDLLGAVVLGCVAVGIVLLLRPRLAARDAARRLDRRFRLNNQLATALEVQAQGAPQGVALRLLEQSEHTIDRVQRYVSERQRFPWSEVATLLALLVLGLGLLLFVGLGFSAPQAVVEPLPPLVNPQAQEEFPAEPFTQPQGGAAEANGQNQAGTAGEPGDIQSAASQSAAVAALADALRDQSATRPIAEALDQGDTSGAAQGLRELADQVGQLSQSTREDLADALREAASQMSTENLGLAEQLRQDAAGLQQGGQSAAQALDNLASAVEQLGGLGQPAQQDQPAQSGQSDQGQPGQPDQQGQSDQGQAEQGQGQGQGGGAGSGALRGEQQSSERLNVEGVPLELESEGEGRTPTDGDPQGLPATSTGGTGRFEQGPRVTDSTKIQTGADPLRIPVDLRDVVQEYFSPPQ